jgi:hypothetical protein
MRVTIGGDKISFGEEKVEILPFIEEEVGNDVRKN